MGVGRLQPFKAKGQKDGKEGMGKGCGKYGNNNAGKDKGKNGVGEDSGKKGFAKAKGKDDGKKGVDKAGGGHDKGGGKNGQVAKGDDKSASEHSFLTPPPKQPLAMSPEMSLGKGQKRKHAGEDRDEDTTPPSKTSRPEDADFFEMANAYHIPEN